MAVQDPNLWLRLTNRHRAFFFIKETKGATLEDMEGIFGAATPMDVKSFDDPEDIRSDKKDMSQTICIERSPSPERR